MIAPRENGVLKSVVPVLLTAVIGYCVWLTTEISALKEWRAGIEASLPTKIGDRYTATDALKDNAIITVKIDGLEQRVRRLERDDGYSGKK